MNKRITGFVVVAVFALATALAASAQHGVLGAVRGWVIGQDGKPLVGAVVHFRNINTQQKQALKTDKSGEFFGTGLQHGDYEIRIEHQGKELAKIPKRLVYGGMQGNPNDISFRNEFKFDFSKAPSQQQSEEAAKQSEEQKKSLDAFDKAVALNRDAKYEDALAELLPLMEKDPTQWGVHAQMGVAYQNLKRWEEAEASYKKAIELQPSNPTLYSNLGQVYVKMGKQEEARQMFDAAAQLSPEDAASAYYNIAVTFINAGDMKAAVDPLRKATELDPSRAEAHFWLGTALFNQSEYKTEGGEMKTIVPAGTREAFDRYLQLQPNGPHAADAKAMLEAIDATVPAAMRVRKK
ncbi:MAG: tetratricopeptide repeat protein [Candidatus Acidiferrales bacterium]